MAPTSQLCQSSAFYGKMHTKHLAQELAHNSLDNTAVIAITVFSSNHDLKELGEARIVEKQSY